MTAIRIRGNSYIWIREKILSLHLLQTKIITIVMCELQIFIKYEIGYFLLRRSKTNVTQMSSIDVEYNRYGKSYRKTENTCLCCSRISSCSCRLTTSNLVAGVVDTSCLHNCPSSSHSFGGKIVLRISSVSCFSSVITPATFFDDSASPYRMSNESNTTKS